MAADQKIWFMSADVLARFGVQAPARPAWTCRRSLKKVLLNIVLLAGPDIIKDLAHAAFKQIPLEDNRGIHLFLGIHSVTSLKCAGPDHGCEACDNR
jgi:hypothetical protein